MRQWLRTLRKNNHLTQNDMADMMGISQNYYCNIENKERLDVLTLDIAAKLSDIFNIPLSTIRNYEEELLKGGE